MLAEIVIVPGDRTLATWTDAFDDSGLRQIVLDVIFALEIGLLLQLPLLLQVFLQGGYRILADSQGDHDANRIPDIAAITWQIRHQLYKEGEQAENDEAPDKGPVGFLAMFGKQVAGGGQQGQDKGESISKKRSSICL